MNTLAKIILTPFLIIGSALGFYGSEPVQAPIQLAAALPQGVAVFETSLQSPITSSATSMTLTANSVRGGSTLSGYNCFTIDEGSAQAEYTCGTVSGTTVSSLARGVDPVTATTTNATLQFAHRRGANVKITDFPLIQIMRNQLNGNDTLPNSISYNGAKTPVVGSYNLPTWDYVKTYADGLAIAGAPNADETTKGIIELATQLEMASSTNLGGTAASLVLQSRYATSSPYTSGLYIPITRNDGKISPLFQATTSSDTYNFAGSVNLNGTGIHTGLQTFTATTTVASTTRNGSEFGGNIVNSYTGAESITGATLPKPVMMATTTGRVSMIDSDLASTTAPFLGFAINTCTNGTTCYVQTDGVVGGFTGLTTGSEYFVTDTAGTISTTVGTAENYVGRAFSSSQIMIEKGRTMQYLGTQALTCGSSQTTVVNQPWARFAILETTFTAPVGASAGQVTLTKSNNHTSVQTDVQDATAGNVSALQASWVNGGIVLNYTSNSSSCTATAYYYK